MDTEVGLDTNKPPELECWQTRLFGEKLQKKGLSVSTKDILKDLDYLMIFFSDQRCPPSRSFTRILKEKYSALKEAGKKFEIIFVSSDQSLDQFNKYYKTMPWLALPYDLRKLKAKLTNHYGCKGIPNLVVINAQTGETVTKNGRSEISSAWYIENYPYFSKKKDLPVSTDGISEGLFLMFSVGVMVVSGLLIKRYLDKSKVQSKSWI